MLIGSDYRLSLADYNKIKGNSRALAIYQCGVEKGCPNLGVSMSADELDSEQGKQGGDDDDDFFQQGTEAGAGSSAAIVHLNVGILSLVVVALALF